MKTLTISNTALQPQKAKLYTQVFGEAPWNEGLICKNCGTLFPLSSQQTICTKCKSDDLEAFYKQGELIENFQSLALRPGYIERIAEILDRGLVGFAWGWNTSLEDLNQQKLGLDKNQYNRMIQVLSLKFPDYRDQILYYFAEIGVQSEYRGQDIAGELYRSKMQAVKSDFSIVRTTRKSPVPFDWFVRDGFQVIFEYEDERDRVILMKRM